MKTVFYTLALLSLISCSKLNEKKQFFGDWRVLKKEQKNAQGNWEDVTKECEKDDGEAYRNMGKWFYDPGQNRCTNIDNIATGSWNYEPSQQRIVYTSTAKINIAEAYVIEISKTNMVLELYTGDTLATRISYKKL